MATTTATNEDYLEAILKLEGNNKEVKSVKLAEYLGITKAAVSIAMKELIEKGFVTKESYGAIFLTEKGREVASEVQHKHDLIKSTLMSIGVSEETAETECCKIEHILSEETLSCLKRTRLM